MATEALFTQSAIWIFGRVLDDIEIVVKKYEQIPTKEGDEDATDTPPRRGQNNFLLEQLRHRESKPSFARIYAFSYEGHYHDLDRPTVFLVHGAGIDPEGPAGRTPAEEGDISRQPPHVGRTGVGTQMGNFGRGMRAWAYDRADFTLRLDVDTGSFDLLLLSQELGGGDAMTQSAGSLARSAGSLARSAGSLARSAGSLV